jgi:hypothetical protein
VKPLVRLADYTDKWTLTDTIVCMRMGRSTRVSLIVMAAVMLRLFAQAQAADENSPHKLLFVPVRIAGSTERSFALDTGATSTALVNEPIGRRFDLRPHGTVILGGAGSSRCKAMITDPVSIVISGKKLDPQPVELIDLGPLEQFVGMPIDGIVGGTLFDKYAMELDYPHLRAIALSVRARELRGMSAIPMSKRFGLCCVVELSLSINGRKMAGRFLVDTGAPDVDLALGPAFAKKNDVVPSLSSKVTSLPALCATTSLAEYGQSVDVRLGTLKVAGVRVVLSLDQAGAFVDGGFDGVVGGAFLRRFQRVVIDGPNARLLLRLPDNTNRR